MSSVVCKNLTANKGGGGETLFFFTPPKKQIHVSHGQREGVLKIFVVKGGGGGGNQCLF